MSRYVKKSTGIKLETLRVVFAPEKKRRHCGQPLYIPSNGRCLTVNAEEGMELATENEETLFYVICYGL